MIPILYESNETEFRSNGLGRLRDCIDCVVTEERNGIYECDFTYPINGSNYDRIKLGRIIAVEHDDTNDVQPFDIVSCTRPIDGKVTFHATHISYRMSKMVANGSNINSLASAFNMLKNASPSNPFTYESDQPDSGYMAAADGVPKTVRQFLGGVEGSILDTYRGEYEWDKFRVILHSNRGTAKDFTIRYGVDLTDYNEELDYSESYSSVIPYWTGSDVTVVGSQVTATGASYNGRDECVPLDLSDKFESQPTTAQLQTYAQSYVNSSNALLPKQNITVKFVRLTDSIEYQALTNLFRCQLCDTIKVAFPRYNMVGRFKIVKTVYDVLQERFTEMELGTLSTTLAEALGISSMSGGNSEPASNVVETGTANGWTYRKWSDGTAECWQLTTQQSYAMTNPYGSSYYAAVNPFCTFPSGLFTSAPSLQITRTNTSSGAGLISVSVSAMTQNSANAYVYSTQSQTLSVGFSLYAVGKWK
jgi:phage minor structural protein